MKAMIDLIMLSVAFWLAAAKLFLYFHPIEAPHAHNEQVWEQIEERPDPEVQSLLEKSNQEVINAKVDKDQAEEKAKQAAIRASEIEKAKIDVEHKIAELEAAKRETEKKLQELQDSANKSVEEKAAAEKQAREAKASEEQLRKELEEIKKQADSKQKALEDSDIERQASEKRIQEMETALQKQPEHSDKVFETELVRHWSSNLEDAKKQAVKTNTPVFAVFEGEVCPICKWLNANVYSDARVSPILRGKYIPVWLLCSEGNLHNLEEYQKPHPAYTFPYCVVIKPDGSWRAFTPYYSRNESKEVHIEHFLSDLKQATN